MDYVFIEGEYENITPEGELCPHCRNGYISRYKYINISEMEYITYCKWCKSGYTTFTHYNGEPIKTVSGVSDRFLAYISFDIL